MDEKLPDWVEIRKCPYCHQDYEHFDWCKYYKSKGKTCNDPNCRECLGDRALVFDVT